MATARLITVDLPDFGMPAARPEVPAGRYAERLAALRERAAAAAARPARRVRGPRAQREPGVPERLRPALRGGHAGRRAGWRSADPGGQRVLRDGRCRAARRCAASGSRTSACPSQPRDRSRPLRDILAGRGSAPGTRVGVLGWKSYADPARIEIPAFIVDELRAPRRAARGSVDERERAPDRPGRRPAGDQRRGPDRRVRARVVPDVRRHPAGCSRASSPAMTEAEAVRLLRWNGMPLSCHLMLTAGPRAALGLLSPADRPIGRGEPFTTAFGIWGALTCRAGWVAEDADELPDGVRDYVDRLVGALLRGGRRVVRRRSTSARSAARSRRSSTGAWATRSSASASTRATSCTSTSG